MRMLAVVALDSSATCTTLEQSVKVLWHSRRLGNQDNEVDINTQAWQRSFNFDEIALGGVYKREVKHSPRKSTSKRLQTIDGLLSASGHTPGVHLLLSGVQQSA